VSAIRTNAAALMLGVSPNTLRSWERRYGFRRPQRSENGVKVFDFRGAVPDTGARTACRLGDAPAAAATARAGA
jgi:uncharacterized protein YjcR